jgi:methyltransferase family protein
MTQSPVEDPAIRSAFPNGHFYSPVVDPLELSLRADEIWPANAECLGIEFNPAHHREVLETILPRHLPRYDYPETLEETPELDRFFTRNSQFNWLDPRVLFALVNEWRPRRMIEVGSGFSSLLVADVNRRFLDNALEFTCIEPYPRPFLQRRIEGITRVIEAKVQDVRASEFERLEAGDILFVDSSHVAKAGSDVNYLVFEVFPRLRAGVRVHIHDIFLPADYPRDWVLVENRSWNEQYVVRALLMYSRGFRILFGSNYAFLKFPELICKALNLAAGRAFGGGSLWLEKVA